MANNNGIFNAALAGFIQGASSSWISSAVSGDYNSLGLAAQAFATRVDSKIPFDGDLNQDFFNLMLCICAGVMSQRYQVNSQAQNPEYWDSIATKIVAAWQGTEGYLVE